jgi:molecular chaperone GrpE (heat shock protein)
VIDKRLEVTDAPREVAPGLTTQTPLVAIMWRVLRADYQRRTREKQQGEAEAKHAGNSLAALADGVHRLRSTIRSVQTALDAVGKRAEAQQLFSISQQLEDALSDLDITIIAPEGEPFTADLMELLDNIAQQPTPGVEGPRVIEIVKPAIKRRGSLLRMGKAIIAIPAKRVEAAEVETGTTESES